jgi:hypothetical protein
LREVALHVRYDGLIASLEEAPYRDGLLVGAEA